MVAVNLESRGTQEFRQVVDGFNGGAIDDARPAAFLELLQQERPLFRVAPGMRGVANAASQRNVYVIGREILDPHCSFNHRRHRTGSCRYWGLVARGTLIDCRQTGQFSPLTTIASSDDRSGGEAFYRCLPLMVIVAIPPWLAGNISPGLSAGIRRRRTRAPSTRSRPARSRPEATARVSRTPRAPRRAPSR